ncbi:MAG: radical SAM protein, partial [Bacteroidetes bacterium]|nr:radical SAM protein [Bacteroidota bacterium]
MSVITESSPVKKVEIQPQSSLMLPRYSLQKQWLKIWFYFRLIYLAIVNLRSLSKIIQLVKGVLDKFSQTNDMPQFVKVAKVDDRYFWRLGSPGFPSKAMDEVIVDEYHRITPFKEHKGLRTILIGITKKCPLSCEHCFEWPNLNQKETMTTEDLIHLVKTYQDFGTSQIWFGGGEPMVRIKDIYKVLETTRPGSDFWIYTSGFGFNREHAFKLKASGLTGIIVSIDHFDQEQHDRFRGYPGAFESAVEACIQAKAAGLVVSLALCATPEFTTKENMDAYLELGRKLGVTFIQLVEARNAGRYLHQQVSLSEEQLGILNEVYHRYNTDPAYWDYPIILWPDQQRRNVGCLAGGNRFFYIDTDGDAHACPFCTRKVCSTLTNEPLEVIRQMQQGGCHVL